MRNLALALIWAAALSFLAATILVVFGKESLPFLNTGPEGFSRVSSNLALIAIALGVWFRQEDDD